MYQRIHVGVKLKVLDERLLDPKSGFTIPEYETEHSAGMDLRAMIAEELVLEPGETQLIPTGIAIKMPDGVCSTILPKSGLGHKKGLVLGNLVGLIDEDYIGQVFISAWNRSKEPITIPVGERIAQLVFFPVLKTMFKMVDELEDTERGDGGFGSTGTH